MKNGLRDNYLKLDIKAISKCKQLPQCTAKFLTEHPRLYEAVLGKSVPPKCRLKMTRVLQIEARYSCRNEGSSEKVVGRSQRQQTQLQPHTQNEQNSLIQGVGCLLREFLPLMGMLPNVQQSGLLTISGGASRGSALADELVAAAPRSRPSYSIVQPPSSAEKDKEQVAKKNIKEELAVAEVTDQVAENSAEQVAGEENAEQLAGKENCAEKDAKKKIPPSIADILGAFKDRQKEKADERRLAKAKAKAKTMELPQPAVGASEAQTSAKSQAQRATAEELETKRTKEKN